MAENIFLEISIQKLDDSSLIEYLRERLDEITEKTNIPIDFKYGGIRTPLWPQGRYELIDKEIPNIICISGLWIPKEIRREKLATNIIGAILDALGADTLIFAEAGVLKMEYPEEEYSLEEVEGKTVIPVKEIIENVQHFYATNGFIDVSDLLSVNDIKKIMIAGLPLGSYAREYIIATNTMRNSLCYDKVTEIYKKAFVSVIQMYNDENVYFFPYIDSINDEDNIPREYIGGDITNKEWSSSYELTENSTEREKLIAKCAEINRNYLTPLGGSEVRCTPSDFIIGPNAILFKPNRTTGLVSDEYITYKGYALFKNGLWEPWHWYYDLWDCAICDCSDARDDICLYIGIAINISDGLRI